MLVLIPEEISTKEINDLCVLVDCKSIKRSGIFCEVDENMPILALCDLAAKNGYIMSSSELGSMMFKDAGELKNKLPKPLTSQQVKNLRKKEPPSDMYRRTRDAVKVVDEQNSIDILSPEEKEHLQQSYCKE